MPPRKKTDEVVEKKPRQTRKKSVPVVEEAMDSLASLLGMDEYVAPIIEEVKETKYSPFDFINQITYGKQDLIQGDETLENQYNAFIINKGLSQSQDCVIYANEMNSRHHIPKFAQNKFLISIVTKRKRFERWTKQEENADLEFVMEYFNYSKDKALSALQLLSVEDLAYMRKKRFKGGNNVGTRF